MDSIKGLLGTIAPWIGTALGGPLGGAAAGALVKALGLPSDTDTKDLTTIQKAIMGATPEQMLAIKKQDEEFQVQMETLGFTHMEKLESISMTNVINARDREIKVGDHTNRNLAYAYTIGYFGLMAFIIWHGIPTETKDLVMTLLGMLSAALLAINTYYFGSSSGSAHKTELLGNALDNAQTTGKAGN
jgi:Flp pilus assembly protein TadB